MSPSWNDPDHEPAPPHWDAREDGELESLARLYRENAPPEPDWPPVQARIERRLAAPGRRGRAGYLVGLVAASAAALFAGAWLTRGMWVASPAEQGRVERQAAPAEDEEPYPVALLSEVEIIGMHPDDADRVLMGQPLLGAFELAAAGDIEINKAEPSPEEGWVPRLRRSKGAPPIIVARTTDEDDEP
jgi:hypothetical protein